MAGYLVVYMGLDSAAARSKLLAGLIVFVGAAALGARIIKHGFDPYDLQTAFLMIVIFFGIFLRLNQARTVWKIPGAVAKFGASYSYSLYLVHNTVLVIVFENTHGLPRPLAIGIGVVLAHMVAMLVYHLFEKHHRAVGTYLRPIFTRKLLRSDAVPAPQPQPAPAAVPVAASVAAAPVMPEKPNGPTLGAPDVASAQP
jgi:peptidoglycan/LPS O-acetylase OafA/YrhL